METLEQGVKYVFEHSSHLALVFLLLTLSWQMLTGIEVGWIKLAQNLTTIP